MHPPTITVGGKPCAVIPSTSTTQTQLLCRTPSGVGSLPVVVTVNGQSSNSTALYAYSPPVVAAISPASGPTSGRAAPTLNADGSIALGPPLSMTVLGAAFGAWADALTFGVWVAFLEPASGGSGGGRRLAAGTQGTPPFAVPLGYTAIAWVNASSALAWNDSAIVVPMLAGAGAGLSVVVAAPGGALSAPGAVSFSYERPSISYVTREDMQPAQCAPRAEPFSFLFNGATIVRALPVSAGCYGTAGGYPLQVVGNSFGSSSALVFINGTACPAIPPAAPGYAPPSDYVATCTVPQGLGEALNVTVCANGLCSVAVPGASRAAFSYDPPLVQAVTPNPGEEGGRCCTHARTRAHSPAPPLLRLQPRRWARR